VTAGRESIVTMRIRAVFLLAALAALLSGCGDSQDRPRNLVIILVDTLRADHVGYHGGRAGVSPVIDELAGRSWTFMNHHSTSSRTGPSVASIITGLFPRSHGVINPLTAFDAKGVLHPDRTTLAEILADRGYDCRGYVANLNVSRRFGFAQGFAEYEYVRSAEAADINRLALAALDGARADRPFFLYLHYMEPHSPYAAPPAYRDLYVDPGYHGPADGRHRQLNDIVAGDLAIGEADAAHLRALYDQEITYVDQEIGRILARLRERGLDDETVVVVMADHGEEFLDHGSVLHGYTLYTEQLHVPLLIHDPRERRPRRVDAVTRHVDVLPTLLAMLDVTAPDGVEPQGRDLLAPAAADDAPVVAEASLMAVRTVRQRSLQEGGWKVIEHLVPEAPPELYHVAVDPAEQRDVLADHPGEAQRLRVRLAELLDAMPAATAAATRLTDEEIRTLRSLGYVK
jgi:choline-sulfatase